MPAFLLELVPDSATSLRLGTPIQTWYFSEISSCRRKKVGIAEERFFFNSEYPVEVFSKE